MAALRQHIAATDRIHGVFLKAGEKPNIVPDHTVAQWYVRSATVGQPPGAQGAGAGLPGGGGGGRRLHHGGAPAVARSTPTCARNRPLVELYRANSARLGRPVAEPTPATRLMVSTDMGNVSYRVPTIHPIVKVSPPDVALHSAEFARWAASPEGDRAVLDGAKAMAMTVVDLWLRPRAPLEEVRAAFDPAP